MCDIYTSKTFAPGIPYNGYSVAGPMFWFELDLALYRALNSWLLMTRKEQHSWCEQQKHTRRLCTLVEQQIVMADQYSVSSSSDGPFLARDSYRYAKRQRSEGVAEKPLVLTNVRYSTRPSCSRALSCQIWQLRWCQ